MFLIMWEANTGETGNIVVSTQAEAKPKLEEVFQAYGELSNMKVYRVGDEIDTTKIRKSFQTDTGGSINGLVDLPTDAAERFRRTYRKHLKAMGADARGDYMPGKIQKVAYEPGTNMVIVTFMNGNWFHYDANGTWW